MKGMKKSMFISTVLMVVILIVALSTATFAWFASNDTAAVNSTTLAAASAADANIAINWTAGGDGTSITFENKTGLRPAIPKAIPVGNTAGIAQAKQYAATTTNLEADAFVTNGVTYGATTADKFRIVEGYSDTKEFVIAGSPTAGTAPAAANNYYLTLVHRDMIYRTALQGYKTATNPTAFAALTAGRDFLPFTQIHTDADSTVSDNTTNPVTNLVVIADGAGETAYDGSNTPSIEVANALAYYGVVATEGQVLYYAPAQYAKVAYNTVSTASGTTTNTPTSVTGTTKSNTAFTTHVADEVTVTNVISGAETEFLVAVDADTTPGTLKNTEVDVGDVQKAVAESGFGLTLAQVGQQLYCVQDALTAANNRTLTTNAAFEFNAYSILGGANALFNSNDGTANKVVMTPDRATLDTTQQTAYDVTPQTVFYVTNKNGSVTTPPIEVELSVTIEGDNAERLRVAVFTSTVEGGTPTYKYTFSSGAGAATTYGIIVPGHSSVNMPTYAATNAAQTIGSLAANQSMAITVVAWYDGTLLSTTYAGLDAQFSMSFSAA